MLRAKEQFQMILRFTQNKSCSELDPKVRGISYLKVQQLLRIIIRRRSVLEQVGMEVEVATSNS